MTSSLHTKVCRLAIRLSLAILTNLFISTCSYMQHQAHLTNLAEARKDLFETFTLPSMEQQTNQEFLWLIFTDKELPKEQVDFFHNILPNNALLIASEQEQDTTLRNLYGHSWTTFHQSVLAGNVPMLYDYYQASESHILVETRLDSDDALSHTVSNGIRAPRNGSCISSRTPAHCTYWFADS